VTRSGRATVAAPPGTATRVLATRVHRFLAHRAHADELERACRDRIVDTPILAVLAVLAVLARRERVRTGEFRPEQAARGTAAAALAARVAWGPGVWLPEACASANATHPSVPLRLTETIAERRAEAARRPTVRRVAQSGAFRTTWLGDHDGGDEIRAAAHGLHAGGNHIDPGDSARRSRYMDVRRGRVALATDACRRRREADRRAPPRGPQPPSRRRAPPRRRVPARADRPWPAARETLRDERSVEHPAGVLDAGLRSAFTADTSDHREHPAVDHNGLGARLGPRAGVRDGMLTNPVP
jgi:hypothetical protein